uniref:Uncharacterized protein n=1 Tax=Candidatus Kentrum sp. MB TaxID=2138164 RepID=A0A451B8I6_9GAMM|nr:MAG: hypothetical protein BECKMB1821G_GA0114241_100615 [Candidatus Kentron sp. MB]VFK26682.1 MAG: hypothetical protein BECKMB1821I_GA0114274_100188 [Candidatus Kentron sp. MB]VFK74596.1 MAG: hypothetical protein BECKMB1821H_GA0114242_100715 [Candidatus Kentron sp. MB]
MGTNQLRYLLFKVTIVEEYRLQRINLRSKPFYSLSRKILDKTIKKFPKLKKRHP